MKWQAVIVLVAIIVGIAAPPVFGLSVCQDTGIGVVDVCHSAAPALSSNGDMPCMNEYPSGPLPPQHCLAPEKTASPFRLFLLAFQDERPPKH